MYQNKIKFLRIILDLKISLEENVDFVTKETTKYVYFLGRIKNNFDNKQVY